MEQKDYRLAAIMYTDIAGFSRMMERDETGTLELLRFHNDLIGGIVSKRHGTIIKTIGDALLVDFRNTVEALQTALEVQDSIFAHNEQGGALPLLVRIGLHLGDIYFFENDALGEGINIAARLQSIARPGCICFSQDVYNQVLNKIEFRAEKLGKVSLKNITKEIHAYEITTPNVEYDPDRDRPRPGYQPGAWLEGEATVASTDVSGSRESPSWASDPPHMRSDQETSGLRLATKVTDPTPLPEETGPVQTPSVPAPAVQAAGGPSKQASASPTGDNAGAQGIDRSYSEEGSRSLLTEIRKAILEDIKKEGRRLTIAEARERYGFYGVEAEEVIAAMADQGLLVRSKKAPSPQEDRPAATDIGKTIEAAVHGIVTEIERSVERNIASGNVPDFMKSRMERLNAKLAGKGERIQEKIADKGARLQERLERRGMRHQGHHHGHLHGDWDSDTYRWDRKLDEDQKWQESPESKRGDFAAYRESLVARARHAVSGFVGHLSSFVGVNALLWYLNLTTSPHFLWAAIVSAGWGIGLVSNAASAIRSRVKARQAEALPDLDEAQLKLFRDINRSDDSMLQHVASTTMVAVLLGQINFMTDPHFLWFLIPAGALAISVVSHLGAWIASKPRLERRFRESLGVSGGWRAAAKAGIFAGKPEFDLGPYTELWREAERTKAAMLGENGGQDGAGEDLGPVLADYVAQIKLLAASARDIDRIVDSIPMDALARDKAELAAKEAASGPALRGEYRKNIEEIEKQERSFSELSEQREVIRLRLSSSVNQLKQMRMDIARVKAAGQGGAVLGDSYDKLKSRTEELSRYLEDLRKGYDESRKDPFAELERQYGTGQESGDPEDRQGKD